MDIQAKNTQSKTIVWFILANDSSRPQDGTVASSVTSWRGSCVISNKNFEEVSDSPKETMKDKVVKAGAEAIKKV